MWRRKCAAGSSAGWSPRDANPRAIRVLFLGQASFDRPALDSARRAASRQVSRRLSRARRDKPADAVVDTSFSWCPAAAFVDRRTTVTPGGSGFRRCATGSQINPCGVGLLKYRPSHTLRGSLLDVAARCVPLLERAHRESSCPWPLSRPSRAVWLRFLSVFDRSSRGLSRARRPERGARASNQQAAGQGRRTDRQRLAQRRSSFEESARQACSAVAGACPRDHIRVVAPRRWRLPRGATARYARQPSP